MRQLETNIFKRLRERVSRPTDRFDRVENGLGEGMPDCNYCILGTEGWIEIKAPTEPVKPETPLFGSNHQVSIEQIGWMHRQHLARGLSWLFIGTQKRLILIRGCDVVVAGAKINAMTVAQLERKSVWTTPVPVKNIEVWQDLRELLSTPPV